MNVRLHLFCRPLRLWVNAHHVVPQLRLIAPLDLDTQGLDGSVPSVRLVGSRGPAALPEALRKAGERANDRHFEWPRREPLASDDSEEDAEADSPGVRNDAEDVVDVSNSLSDRGYLECRAYET